MRQLLRRSALAAAVLTAAAALSAAPALRPATGGVAQAATIGCGATVKKATGGVWKCVFSDGFSGSTLNRAAWRPQVTATSGYHVGPECFVDSPNNVSVGGGYLRLTARKEAAPFTCATPGGGYATQYTSGMVSQYGLFSQAYGRYEVRAKLPAATVAGLQEAFWLWPDNPAKYGAYPASGEIDFMEAYSSFADRVIPYVHYTPATFDPNMTNNFCLVSNVSAFHSYVVEWTPQAITVKFDGRTCIADDWNPAAPLVKPQPFDSPFFLALTQALGIGGNAFDPATTPLPATTTIDYVRIWS